MDQEAIAGRPPYHRATPPASVLVPLVLIHDNHFRRRAPLLDVDVLA